MSEKGYSVELRCRCMIVPVEVSDEVREKLGNRVQSTLANLAAHAMGVGGVAVRESLLSLATERMALSDGDFMREYYGSWAMCSPHRNTLTDGIRVEPDSVFAPGVPVRVRTDELCQT